MALTASLISFILPDRWETFRSNELFSDRDIPMGHDTPKWHYMKKHMMVAMKQHSDGLKHLEAMTIKYGEDLLHKMDAYRGEPFDPAELLIMMTASIMLTLIYGPVTEEDVKKHVYLGKQEFKLFQPNDANLMLDILPISRFILPFVEKAHSFLTEVINSYATLYDNIAVARRKLYKHPEVEYLNGQY